jgi:hypothetical protein
LDPGLRMLNTIGREMQPGADSGQHAPPNDSALAITDRDPAAGTEYGGEDGPAEV